MRFFFQHTSFKKRTLFIWLFFAPPILGQSIPLFIIQRSLNKNEVHYDLKVDGGKVDKKSPLSVYWILKEKGGEKEALTGLERRKAYGYSIHSLSDETLTFSLVSLPKEKITIFHNNALNFVATLPISGEKAILKKVYLTLSKGGLIPKVTKIELEGLDAKTLAPVKESRILD